MISEYRAVQGQNILYICRNVKIKDAKVFFLLFYESLEYIKGVLNDYKNKSERKGAQFVPSVMSRVYEDNYFVNESFSSE